MPDNDYLSLDYTTHVFKGLIIEHTGLTRIPHYLCKWINDLHNLHVDKLFIVTVIYKPKIIKIYSLLLEIWWLKVWSENGPLAALMELQGAQTCTTYSLSQELPPTRKSWPQHVQNTRYSNLKFNCSTRKGARGTKIKRLHRDVSNYPHTKYHNNPSKGSWVILAETQTDRQTDKQTR